MTRRRWIADEFSADRAALTGEHAAHLSRTLRARVGQEFEVACGDQLRRATVANVTDDRVEFVLGEEVAASAAVPITLLLAIFKFDRLEWAIEKCTELNVTTIVPVIARRTEKHLAIAAEKRVERWRRITREASEQSRRISPPEIREPMKLKDALRLDSLRERASVSSPEIELHGSRLNSSHDIEPRERLLKSSQNFEASERVVEPLQDEPPENQPRRGGIEFSPGRKPWVSSQIEPSPVGTAPTGNELRIVLAETKCEVQLSEVLRSHQNVASLALAIGPEGGWAADELQSFASLQWIAASLGETILRAETAAIAALAIARAEI
jgi:16S rRNA (uracil1498-N3)-methyltransferase